MAMDLREFEGERCLITGGLGFIGSNLAHRLVALGARVLIVDSLIPAYGGNLFNIADIRDKVHVNIADVRDRHAMEYLVRGQDYIFNLAGQIGHLESMEDPRTDLRINTEGPLTVLEACRRHNRAAKVLYASTRTVYGRPQPEDLPLTESHPIDPIDCNAVSNIAGEHYHRLYCTVHGVRTVCLRLTNTYGPRQMMKDVLGRYALIYHWMRRVMDGEPLRIMGGHQERDLLYVDDCVEALLLAALTPQADGEVYNVGGEAISLLCLAELLLELAGGGRTEIVELPAERRAIDPGKVYLSYAKARRELGWQPRCGLREGLARTIAFYRVHRRHYWNDADVAQQQIGGLQVAEGSEEHSTMSRSGAPSIQPQAEAGAEAQATTQPSATPIPFNLTKPQYLELKAELDGAIHDVLDESFFILGKQVEAFEREFAAYLGVPYAVGVGSGTDAIHLALRALGVGPGDDVLTVAHTAVATTVAISASGATPVFVDIDPATFTMDMGSLEAKRTRRTKAVVPVHLYGHPAAMVPLLEFARRSGLYVVEDAAQAHGAAYGSAKCGTFGDAAAFSFYPTKNLGAYGDGGAVVTRDAAVAERLRQLREYGWESGRRYYSVIKGVNSRLDELQAAVLRVKLRHLDEGNARRRRLADLYGQLLEGVAGIARPQEQPPASHVYHLFVVRAERRDALQAYLRSRHIGTQIHYPEPVHRQAAYLAQGYAPGSLPETERACGEILSLPIYPELPAADVRRVAGAIREFFMPASSATAG